MTRAFFASTVVVLSFSCESVVRIGAVPSPNAERAALAVVEELARSRRSAHVVRCETARACAASLMAGDVEVAVVDETTYASIPGAAILADTGAVDQLQLVAPMGSRYQTIDELAAHRGQSLRIATSGEYLAAPSGGLAGLVRAYGVPQLERVVVDDANERLASVDRGVVDAALVDTGDVVGRYRPLVDTRGALTAKRLLVVSVRPREELRAAASTVRGRLAMPPDAEAFAIAVTASLDADFAVNILARTHREARVELLAVAQPLDALRAGEAEFALVPATGVALADIDIEAVATFDRGTDVPLTLWQAEAGKLDRSDGERLLAASKLVRLPNPVQPSVWKRAPPPKPREDPASPWLDSVVNVLAFAFVLWLIVAIFRRHEPGEKTSDSD